MTVGQLTSEPDQRINMKVNTAVPLLILTQALIASSQQSSGSSVATASVPNPTACADIVNGGRYHVDPDARQV